MSIFREIVHIILFLLLFRLGLERGKTAEEALNVICSLLEKYGQGGPCCEDKPDACYFNSFIIADRKEAWVLETSQMHWAAEKVTGAFSISAIYQLSVTIYKCITVSIPYYVLCVAGGVRNISNQLSIGTKIDKMSEGLQDYAKSKGYWDGNGDFHFANIFTAPPRKCINLIYGPFYEVN